MELSYIKNLVIGFSIIILLMLANALYNNNQVDKVTQETAKLYKHPYTVSNTLFKIQDNLTSMHRYMKDVALATSPEEIEVAINKVSDDESNIYTMLPTLYDRYLGDKESIELFEKDFRAWKVIRSEVILLSAQGEKESAAIITKGKGAKHLLKVQESLNVLIVYAKNKGDFFFNTSVKTKESAKTLTFVISLISIFFALLIMAYILRVTKVNEKILKDYIYTIDKNIYSLSFSIDGSIIEASSAICQYLGVSKGDLKDEKIYTFITSDTQREDLTNSVKNGFAWDGEIEYMKDQWLHVSVEPILDDNYKTVKFSMILHDISDKKRIEKVSFTDQLTGLYNRHFFNQHVPNELAYNTREKISTVFVMIDIDHFKLFNDHYGHPEGDSALKAVAKTLKRALKRPHDYVFRLGGEEFGIFLPGMKLEDAQIYVDKIREDIEALNIFHAQSSVSDYVTISLGAIFSEDSLNLTLDDIYEKADSLLYEAKHSGRNRLVLKSI